MRLRRSRLAALLSAGVLVLASCGAGGAQDRSAALATAQSEVETIAAAFFGYPSLGPRVAATTDEAPGYVEVLLEIPAGADPVGDTLRAAGTNRLEMVTEACASDAGQAALFVDDDGRAVSVSLTASQLRVRSELDADHLRLAPAQTSFVTSGVGCWKLDAS